MFKRFLAVLGVLLFLAPAAARAYDDVPSTAPYYYAVEYLRMNKVFPETKNFKPDEQVTKAEFVKWLVTLNNPDFKVKGKVTLPFKDTQNNAWYAPYFYEAIKLGILSDRDLKADPYKVLTMAEAVELVFHSQSIPIPKKYVGSNPFKDLQKNKRLTPMMMRALEFDLVSPDKPDNFGVYRRVKRWEAANMIYRMDAVNLEAPTRKGSAANAETSDPSLQKIISAWDVLVRSYLHREDVNTVELSDAAIRAMALKTGDPYTAYLDKKENQAFSDDLDGQIEGIGAHIGINDNKEITIVAPIKNSPAFKAGVQPGDVVKKVDDADVTGLTLYEVVSKIKGPKGTTVRLTLQRNGQTVTLSVVRDVISIRSVEYEVVRGNIMLIHLYQFSETAAQEFSDAVDVVLGNPNIKGVILDLRDDPGGLLEAAVKILNRLLPFQSPAVTIQYSYMSFTQYTTGPGELSAYPMAVLINKGSASASEIVAGALKDFGIATLVGETSFGKGTVQEVSYFNDNTSLKVTVAKWLTGKGSDIQKNGVTPDIAVERATGTTQDNVLERAIDEVNRKINAKR